MAVAVIGEFDGLHVGHQALLAEARHAADRTASSVVAVVLDRGDGSPALTTLTRRCELLLAEGVDMAVVVGAPDGDVAPIASAVRDRFHAGTAFLACPADDNALRWPVLRPALAGAGVEVVELARKVDRDGRIVTSALIAQELSAGRIDRVTELLGRPHRVSGVVEIGDQRGRTIGFPTANLPLDHSQVWPDRGVYAAHVRAGGNDYAAAVNVGIRPTIYGPDGAPLLEAHVLGFEGDLYGQVIDVSLVARLRPERRFESLDALTEQLARDVEQARAAAGPV